MFEIETISKPTNTQKELGDWEESLRRYPVNYPKDWKNKLILGDNKSAMNSLIEQGWTEKINLIYIDPPFFSGNSYLTYNDKWSDEIDSYLKYMEKRLILMRDLLAENGSIYVHLDWHVGHYVKVLMDRIFTRKCFKNEIIWQRAKTVGRTVQPQKFNVLTDSILFYSKNPDTKINEQKVKKYYLLSDAKNLFKFDEKFNTFFKDAPAGDYSDESIRRLDGEGRIYWNSKGNLRKKISLKYETKNGIKYVVEEIEVGNIWNDLTDMMHATKEEKTGFPTQKPEDLLERIIKASSDEGDIIADFFCGSGTTLAVAEKLDRRWIGCDSSDSAIQVTKERILNIHNSRDLIDESRRYNRHTRPFELWRNEGKKDEKQ